MAPLLVQAGIGVMPAVSRRRPYRDRTQRRTDFGPGTVASGDEAVRLAGELARTRQRAEEVGDAVVDEPPGGAVRIDGHATDWIDGEGAPGGLALADCREDLNRFANVV